MKENERQHVVMLYRDVKHIYEGENKPTHGFCEGCKGPYFRLSYGFCEDCHEYFKDHPGLKIMVRDSSDEMIENIRERLKFWSFLAPILSEMQSESNELDDEQMEICLKTAMGLIGNK